MVIEHEKTENKGSFFIESDGERIAEMVYSMSNPGTMIIEHTEVDESLKGKNIGTQLLDHAANFAREHHLKINPLCSFVKSMFDRKKESYQDVM